MNGLLNQKPEQGEQGQAESQVDPKHQEQYDLFVANGITIIHNEKTSEKLINQILKAEDKVEAVANSTLIVVRKLEDSATANKIKLSENVLMHGANELMGAIIAIAEAAGMEPMTDEQKEHSYSLATSKYIDAAVKTGKITKERLKQMGQEASQTPDGQKIVQKQQSAQQEQAPPPAQPQPTRPAQPLLKQGV